MSQLYYTEQGNVVSTLCEELTSYRRAQKVLHLPATQKGGTLYFLARCSAAASTPLRLSINGTVLTPIAPDSHDRYTWNSVPLDASFLKAGANVVEFWTDVTAMDGWSLAIEGGHVGPQSSVSDDAGRSWRNNRMAYLNVLSGEYIVRIRLQEGQDAPPPAFQWEDRAHPRVQSFRRLLPPGASGNGTRMQVVRALSAWISQSWSHINSLAASVYAPWDPETILSWGKARKGHDGRVPVVMCVHYGVAMVSACQALGIPARCAVLWGTLNGMDGHFAAEVWFDEFQKWVFVDPNVDAIFIKDGIPLSIPEIRDAGDRLSPLIEWGEGARSQRSNPNIERFLDELFLPGVLFRHRAVWPRADFLSHPECSPPGHGSTSYAETPLVWEAADLDRGFGMFPYFGDASYCTREPTSVAK